MKQGLNITIYQIDMDKDDRRVAFLSFEDLEKKGLSVNSWIYNKVFSGQVDCDTLEDVYRMFNLNLPKNYQGRSMSVSDIVAIKKEDDTEYFFCDSVGFKKTDFDPLEAGSIKERKIKVVYCEPGKKAEIKEIENTLENLQSAVGGGLIEPCYPFEEAVCIVCNEEGKFNGMKPNRAVYGENGAIMDVIFGPFFICDASGENFGSLTDEQCEKYRSMFSMPQRIINLGGLLAAIPFNPDDQ